MWALNIICYFLYVDIIIIYLHYISSLYICLKQNAREEEERVRDEAQLMEFVRVRQNLRKIHSALQSKATNSWICRDSPYPSRERGTSIRLWASTAVLEITCCTNHELKVKQRSFVMSFRFKAFKLFAVIIVVSVIWIAKPHQYLCLCGVACYKSRLWI